MPDRTVSPRLWRAKLAFARVVLAWFYLRAIGFGVKLKLRAMVGRSQVGSRPAPRTWMETVALIAASPFVLVRKAIVRLNALLSRLAHRALSLHQRILGYAITQMAGWLSIRQPGPASLAYFVRESERVGANPHLPVAAIEVALAQGETDTVERLARVLLEGHRDQISLQQRAGALCFLAGEYALAERIWSASSDIREELLASQRLNELNLRFLGPSWALAIGHIAHFDIYIKHKILSGNERQRTVFVPPLALPFPNRTLLDCFKPWIDTKTVWDEPPLLLREHIALLQDEFWSLRFGPGDSRMFSHAGSRVQLEWERLGHGPLLALAPELLARGRETLELLGVPRDAWFVCLHVREAGFHKKWHRRHPGTRNADVLTYVDAIKEVVARGGYVVRMGDPSMKRLPAMPGVIDYAHCAEKSEFMDIFLASACRFFVGTNSGLGLVPPLFGVRCVMTNWSPIALPQWYPQDIFIPKLIRSQRQDRFLTFEELFQSKAGWGQFERYFEEEELEVIDNTCEDLTELVCEALDRAEGRLNVSSADEEREEIYARLAVDAGSYHGAKIGTAFLRKYASLLPIRRNENEPKATARITA